MEEFIQILWQDRIKVEGGFSKSVNAEKKGRVREEEISLKTKISHIFFFFFLLRLSLQQRYYLELLNRCFDVL